MRKQPFIKKHGDKYQFSYQKAKKLQTILKEYYLLTLSTMEPQHIIELY
jgi:hypothetical protein